LGIEVVADLPEVGRNLQDHLFAHLKFRLADAGDSLNGELADPDRALAHLQEWRAHGTGAMVTTSSQILGFLRAGDRGPVPTMQIAMRPLSWSIGVRGVPELDSFPGMMASAIGTQPFSRGQVLITSDDPAERAHVDTDYLADERDVEEILAGMRRVREIMAQPAIAERVVAEIDPGEEIVDDEGLTEYLRASASTVYHPAGTCRMGADPGSVVDPALRVRGVGALRVIDNSVMPTITSGNTMAPAFMIGEKGAELLLSGTNGGPRK
jgi:choline dehydrogenase